MEYSSRSTEHTSEITPSTENLATDNPVTSFESFTQQQFYAPENGPPREQVERPNQQVEGNLSAHLTAHELINNSSRPGENINTGVLSRFKETYKQYFERKKAVRAERKELKHEAVREFTDSSRLAEQAYEATKEYLTLEDNYKVIKSKAHEYLRDTTFSRLDANRQAIYLDRLNSFCESIQQNIDRVDAGNYIQTEDAISTLQSAKESIDQAREKMEKVLDMRHSFNAADRYNEMMSKSNRIKYWKDSIGNISVTSEKFTELRANFEQLLNRMKEQRETLQEIREETLAVGLPSYWESTLPTDQPPAYELPVAPRERESIPTPIDQRLNRMVEPRDTSQATRQESIDQLLNRREDRKL